MLQYRERVQSNEAYGIASFLALRANNLMFRDKKDIYVVRTMKYLS